jgi:hypothetical protein
MSGEGHAQRVSTESRSKRRPESVDGRQLARTSAVAQLCTITTPSQFPPRPCEIRVNCPLSRPAVESAPSRGDDALHDRRAQVPEHPALGHPIRGIQRGEFAPYVWYAGLAQFQSPIR